MPRNYYCEMCRDEGFIRRGFLWWKMTCPTCNGDPVGTFRKNHPVPYPPPKYGQRPNLSPPPTKRKN